MIYSPVRVENDKVLRVNFVLDPGDRQEVKKFEGHIGVLNRRYIEVRFFVEDYSAHHHAYNPEENRVSCKLLIVEEIDYSRNGTSETEDFSQETIRIFSKRDQDENPLYRREEVFNSFENPPNSGLLSIVQRKEVVRSYFWHQEQLLKLLGKNLFLAVRAIAFDQTTGEKYISFRLYELIRKLLFKRPDKVIRKLFPKTVEHERSWKINRKLQAGNVYLLKNNILVLLESGRHYPMSGLLSDGKSIEFYPRDLRFCKGKFILPEKHTFEALLAEMMTSDDESTRIRARDLQKEREKSKKKRAKRLALYRRKLKRLNFLDERF